jgi:MFS family permease
MALYSVILAALSVIIDGALMGLIAPAVAQDLSTDVATIGLISSLSMLMLAAFVMGGGTLGDIYGRKRILVYGLIGVMITSAMAMLPYTLSLFVFAILVGGWVGKFSNRTLIGGGLVLMAIGLVAMGFWLSPSAGFWAFLLPLTLLGGGKSIANVPRMNAALATAPPELASAASATNNASIQLGNALGIVILGALFQNVAPRTYYTDLAARGLTGEQIDKSVEVLIA